MNKKYKVIAKVGVHTDGSAHCVKHNVTDLLKYTNYLDNTWPDWRWLNVFDKESRKQLASFTKYIKPEQKWV